MRALGVSAVEDGMPLAKPCVSSSRVASDGSKQQSMCVLREQVKNVALLCVKFVQDYFLLVSFAIAVILAMSWPALGKWLASGRLQDVGILQAINNFIVFFISGLTLKTDDMRNLTKHWPGILYGFFAIICATPFLGFAMVQIPLTPSEFSVGLAIFCVVPTTLGVGVALTAASKGNQALALLLTVGTNVLGIATVPFQLRLILNSSSQLSIDPVNLLVKLVLTVLVPTILGKALRDLIPRVKQFATDHKAALGMFSTFQLALIVLQTLSGARDLLLKQPALGLVLAGIISTGMHVVFLLLNGLMVSKWVLRMPPREAIAVLIMASQKSAPVAVTVITYITGDIAKQGLFAIPCIIGQIAQIFIGSALARYLKVEGTKVVIRAHSQTSFEAAKRMVLAQIEAFKESGGGYPHPLQVVYLLSRQLLPAAGNQDVCFVAADAEADEALAGVERPEPMYILAASSTRVSTGGSTRGSTAGNLAPAGAAGGPNDLAEAMAGLGLGKQATPFFPASSPGPLWRRLEDLLHDHLLPFKPVFDELKLRFNFGKQFFYNINCAHSMTFSQLQHTTIGLGKDDGDFKTVYSNAVSQDFVERLGDWMAEQGLEPAAAKETISLHVTDRYRNAAYTISFYVERGRLLVRKVKSANIKPWFGVHLAPPAATDLRLKLLAMYHFNMDSELGQQLMRVAKGCTLDERGAVPTIRLPTIRLPPAATTPLDLVVDSTRFKTKRGYKGTVQVQGQQLDLSLSINTVRKAELPGNMNTRLETTTGGASSHTEVTGTCANLNTTLKELCESMKAGQPSTDLVPGVMDMVSALITLPEVVGMAGRA